MDEDFWAEQYKRAGTPQLHPVLVGFNVNLDRIIPVSRNLLDLPEFQSDELSEIRLHLIHSMENCTAEEWLVSDRAQYARFTEYFSSTGSLAMGGQAGIAALHLASLGVPDVFCLAPELGPEGLQMLANQGVRVPDEISGAGSGSDTIHLVFEYKPGLVPLAEGALPRDNRFIASPKKTAENTLIPQNSLAAILPQITSCTRAFLSGYQYLQDEGEFARAADQIQVLKKCNPLMRVHIECVSVTDASVLAGLVRHILPVADSCGMNEYELSLLLGSAGRISPAGLVKGVLELAKKTGLIRVHLHTFGYYLLIIHKDRFAPEDSRTALLYAARVVAKVAGGTTTHLSPAGIDAVKQIVGVFQKGPVPGSFTAGDYFILAVPTLIAHDIKKTAGLGDILSSTAFVAERF